MRRFLAATVLALLLVGLALARFENGKINIAVLTLDPFSWPGGELNYTGPLKIESGSLILSYRLWESLVNERGGILVGNTSMPVNLTIVQIGNDDEGQKVATRRAVLTNDFDFYFGPFSSKWSITVAQAMAAFNHTFLLAGHAGATSVFQCEDRPEERPPCEIPWTKRFKRIVGVTPVGELFLQAPINVVALKEAKTIAGWYQDEDFTRSVAAGAYVSARTSGLKTLGEPIAIPISGGQEYYDRAAKQIRDWNPDIVVAGSRVGSCVMFLKACKTIGWLPKALMTTLCANDPNLHATLAHHGLDMDDARYIIDSAVWDPRLKGPEFEDLPNFFFPVAATNPPSPSARQYMTAYKNFTNNDGRFLDLTSAPLAMAQAYALEAAITKTQTLDALTVLAAFPTVMMNSFFGKIAFNGFGQNDAKSVANLQINREGALEILSPLSASTAATIYPMPSWEDRVWVKRPFSYAGEQAIAVLTGLTILFSIAMGIATFILRHRKSIIASSPFFLGLMLIGSILIYVGIFTWTLTTSDAECMARWWLFGIGFILMFGALLVKVWRVSRIFNDNNLAVISISNYELLLVVGIGVLIEVALLVVWTAVGRSKAIRYPIDPIRPKFDYMSCTTTTVGKVILAIAAAYKGLLIIAGVYLSISTWRIKYSIYNESRSIAFGMYNLFFFLVLAIIIQLVINGPNQRKAQFVVRSLMILLGAFFPIAAIFLPKFVQIKHLNSDNVGSSGSQGKTIPSGGGGTPMQTLAKSPPTTTEEKLIERLQLQNERLKEEVKTLRAEVLRLRDKHQDTA